jgi:hypothetical protein
LWLRIVKIFALNFLISSLSQLVASIKLASPLKIG